MKKPAIGVVPMIGEKSGVMSHNPGPLAQHLDVAQAGKEIEHVAGQSLGKVERRAHGRQLVGVQGRASDQLAARRLADVRVQAGRYDNRVEPRLEWLGDKRLERMHHQRRAQADHPLYLRRPAGHRAEHLAGLDKTAIRVHARDPAVLHFNIGDAGLLMDFNAFAVGPACVSPRHGVVAGNGSRRVVECADDGRLVPTAVQVDLGDGLLDELRADDLGVDARGAC